MWIFLAQQAQPKGPPLQPLPHPDLPPVELPPPGYPAWLYIAGALLVLVMLALVIWLLMRPARGIPVEPKRPFHNALRALREILARAPGQKPGDTSAQVSAVLRTYFWERYHIPAPFRTTKELFQDASIPATSQRLRRYSALADWWDRLSFAPVPATADEAVKLVEQALAYLEEDRP